MEKINNLTPFDQLGLEKFHVGMKLYSGQMVVTAAGNKTTPFPEIRLEGNRRCVSTLAWVETWLLENAALEARRRGDELNARIFAGEMKQKRLPQASKDFAEEYLATNFLIHQSILRSL